MPLRENKSVYFPAEAAENGNRKGFPLRQVGFSHQSSPCFSEGKGVLHPCRYNYPLAQQKRVAGSSQQTMFGEVKSVTKRRRASGKAAFRVTDRRLVLIDDAPLRRQAAFECTQAMARLEKARTELKHFEQEEYPAFSRWLAATFGPLLTQIRETSKLISDREQLIQEVEMEMFWECSRNAKRAYANVIKRRENPELGGSPWHSAWDNDLDQSARTPEEEEFFSPENDFEIPDPEAKALFEDYLFTAMGIHPQQLSRAEYQSMFEQFQADILGKVPEVEPFEPKEERHRIKEIYRILVRRLHPDLRANPEEQVSVIWHEVQEAYATGNLERMETLLALTEIKTEATGGKASLSHMRAALVELRRSIRAIQASLRQARGNPAWGFSRLRDRSSLENRIRRQLEQQLSAQLQHLGSLEEMIERWKPKSKPKRRPAGKSSLRPTDLFPF